jgi:hypothetical protein
MEANLGNVMISDHGVLYIFPFSKVRINSRLAIWYWPYF